MSSPLVAERQDSTKGYTGIGIAESAVDVYNGVQNGSWVEGGLGVLGSGLEVLSLALDPLGTLGQYAVSWLIEHIKPLRDALNWLAGDADQIAAYAATWKNVQNAVSSVAEEFRTEVAAGTAGWAGPAADSYRQNTAAQTEHITAAASGAGTIGTVVEVVGALVGTVRGIVRDLVAECISTLLIRLPQWLAEAGLTLGLATPHIVASASALIARWVNRITEVITKLTRSVEKLRPIMAKLGEIWEAIKSGLRKLRTGSTGPDTPNPPSPVRQAPTDVPPAKPQTPDLDTTPPSTTTPSSVDAPTSQTPGTTPSSANPPPVSHVDPPADPGATTPNSTTTDTPPVIPRDYDASGKTIPTNQLQHPHAGLINDDLITAARNNPNREAIINTNGVPGDHPAVRDLLPPTYDPHAGLGEAGWNQQYWPGGETGRYGNRLLEWPDGQAHPQGFDSPEARTPGVLTPGQTIDRFGSARGDFVSPADTPYPQRGLPPDNLDNGYHQYEVLRPLPVWEGPIAPAMGQPGGGTQYVLPHSVVDLINAGYLREIPL
ncbi:TNT domain-containing protein [Actinokineospora pegani]|uniref:TNT domain-containing protein n=1 Tax=Actinokineospora pegani TaxID=2654637 RepID=UPI0012EA7C36|nr:TNT domain-containing protein [Actinokineospora pegani]